jgi:aspartate--ammonia ligase
MTKTKALIPKGYRSSLDTRRTHAAGKIVRDFFELALAKNLNLEFVSGPTVVDADTGVNDNLNGVEKPVSFTSKDCNGTRVEVVHSLAKWKRLALHNMSFKVGEGLYTHMNAIRKDEDLDNIHSIMVHQWDWERVISREQRNEEFLKQIVKLIYDALKKTDAMVAERLPEIGSAGLPAKITFVTTQELEDKYPHHSSAEREALAAKEHGAIFLQGIGGDLNSGKYHDGRAPDYDDWSLNGDIIVWNNVLQSSLELSSMGIRVDAPALESQLAKRQCLDRKDLHFHKLVLDDTLPLSIGGGIGRDRVAMFFLKKAHIGEVVPSMWDSVTRDECHRAGIELM